jgi:hypothetical protein
MGQNWVLGQLGEGVSTLLYFQKEVHGLLPRCHSSEQEQGSANANAGGFR